MWIKNIFGFLQLAIRSFKQCGMNVVINLSAIFEPLNSKATKDLITCV